MAEMLVESLALVFGRPLSAEMLVVSLVSDSNSWAVARVSEERAVLLASLIVELMMLKLVHRSCHGCWNARRPKRCRCWCCQ